MSLSDQVASTKRRKKQRIHTIKIFSKPTNPAMYTSQKNKSAGVD